MVNRCSQTLYRKETSICHSPALTPSWKSWAACKKTKIRWVISISISLNLDCASENEPFQEPTPDCNLPFYEQVSSLLPIPAFLLSSTDPTIFVFKLSVLDTLCFSLAHFPQLIKRAHLSLKICPFPSNLFISWLGEGGKYSSNSSSRTMPVHLPTFRLLNLVAKTNNNNDKNQTNHTIIMGFTENPGRQTSLRHRVLSIN